MTKEKRSTDDVWRLHCLGWTVPEIADRYFLDKSDVRKRIVRGWALDWSSGEVPSGADCDPDRRPFASNGFSDF